MGGEGSVGVETCSAEWYGCIVLPQFAAQAVVRGRADLRGRAVVVMEGVRPTEWVFALTRKAVALGLRPRMTRVEVETFDEVVVLARCAADEAAAQALLREAMGRFTPRVEERGGGADWECVLDLCGTERLLGEPAIAARKLQAAMAELGFEACVVLCGNADAGVSLARVGQGARVIPPGQEACALAGLRVGVLGLAEEHAERFAAWGIRTLGELAALPEVQLIARMGQAGRQLRLRALGILPHHLEPVEKPFSLEETLEFEESIETLEPLLFCMNVMLERLVAAALERALALASVTISLWMERSADRLLEDEISPELEPTKETLLHRSALPIMSRVSEPSVDRAQGAVSGFEARLGMASADAAIRKAWHRAALVGERAAVRDDPSVRGEALRERLGIGDGQAMRRSAAALHLVRADATPVVAATRPVVALPQVVASVQADAPGSAVLSCDEGGKWGQPFERTVRPAVPLLDRSLLLKMLQLDFEANPAPGAVVRLRISAESGRAGKVQLGLFAPPMPEPTRFEDTHARLRSIVGPDNVGRARALDTHAPEQFALETFSIPAPLGKLPTNREVYAPPAIALRHMRPPVAVQVTMREKRIERVWFEGAKFEVARSYGPWRSSGQWWGSEVWSLDMWDIAAEDKDGSLLVCLIGWDLLRECWSVNGIYD